MIIQTQTMNINKQRFFSSAILFMAVLSAFSQQVGSNSPYGRYGYGTLSSPALGASEQMGGISYGLRRSQQVNPGNPASYSKLDTLTFIFDLGASGHYATYDDGSSTQDFYNANLDYIAMQFPLAKKVGASIGLLPYSKVGYSFGRAQSDGDLDYSEIYSGSGGLSQIYGGIAYEPVKNISIGANVAYLFGNIQHVRRLPSIDQSIVLSRVATDKFYIRGVRYDIGLQYTYPLDRDEAVTVGAVYSPRISSSSKPYQYDLLYDADGNLSQILQSDTLSAQTFEFPHTFGLGATYSNRNVLVGLDGSYQLWKNLQYPDYLDGMDDDTRFNNRYRVSAGAEYVIDPYSRNFFKQIRFRGGLSFANSYNNVTVYNNTDDTSIGTGGFKEYGVNVGFGLPFRDTYSHKVSMLNIGFGYSKLKPDKSYMLEEQMFKITLNMNINEFWFFKRQFD